MIRTDQRWSGLWGCGKPLVFQGLGTSPSDPQAAFHPRILLRNHILSLLKFVWVAVAPAEWMCCNFSVPLRDRCNFGRSSWLISQALSVTYVPGEHRLYLERSCRPPENPATADSGMARGLPVPKGLNSRRQFGPAVERRRKSRPRSTGFHGSSPCKCQRLSTLRSSWLPPSRPPTKSGAAQAAVD